MSNLTLVVGNKNLSSWSLRGWLAAKLSGLAFEEQFLELDIDTSDGELNKWSPSKLVPVLIEDGHTIWDSLAITERLAELAPDAGIWPKDPQSRAHARSVVCEMHSGFQSLRDTCPMDITGHQPTFSPNADVQRNIDRVCLIWTECLAKADRGDGPFLYGQYSGADVFYTPVASRFKTYGIELPQELATYRDAVLTHPFMVEWAAGAEQEPRTAG